ncbi:MAG: rRNA cytosine-C5-methyltransferase [Paludibacteraceae bacterium]|nr:rRNA cytosine-C5-methyltransferase [Paludibacteraceae bacterium]
MLPLDFIDLIEPQMGLELDSFCRSLQQEPVTSVRINDKADLNLPWAGRVPWCQDGWYLHERPQFTLDPLLHAGCYYVQEASSMFVEHILNTCLKPDSLVLDLCAAPGGKSTLISQWLGHEGLLVSNEVVRQRVFILSENIQKWGNGNTVVTHNRPADFGQRLPNLFDCVLVDAPCSGEGMFRKDTKAVDEWSLRNVEMCARRQQDILMDVWDTLKPGGLLIYSTCTFNQKEDEDNTRFIIEHLGADLLHVPLQKEWGITETLGYHFYPHKTRGEGFYIAVLRKHEEHYQPLKIRGEKKKTAVPVECEQELRTWLKHPDEWALRQEDRFSIAYPVRYKELIDFLSTRLTCISTGFGVGEMRGKSPAPQHALAMAKDFCQDKFTSISLSLDKALAYLRCEAITLTDQPFGVLLLTYQDIPLGFAKNIGNHCNNLYPKEWRIRIL